MLYLTHAKLMRESEDAVVAHTTDTADDTSRRVCLQLLADARRYAVWHAQHERQMVGVATAHQRLPQIMKLRAVALEQVHRTAFVRYLREQRVVGSDRDALLRAYHGTVVDSRDATLAEHRTYLVAASTQLCASHILDLSGDEHGLDLIRRYELLYGQFLGMFCDQARASARGERYFLDELLPETRDAAQQLRLRILDARLQPLKRPTLGRAAAKIASAPRRPPARAPAGARDAGQRPSSGDTSVLRRLRHLFG